jgi:acyl transferase domain-containing protein
MASDNQSDAAPIAIIGIACRFPRAHGPHEYWELLCQGINAITEVPAERLNPGMSGDAGEASAWGGFIDNVDRFDAAFFGIAPRMASEMDPQQRLLLESAWECLEDAGILPASLAGSRTGVFVGAINRDYQDLLVSAGHTGAHSVLGNTPSGLAARISYALDLRGPSMCVDTACRQRCRHSISPGRAS